MAPDNSDTGRLTPEQLDAMGIRRRYHSATFESFDAAELRQIDALTACAEWAADLARGVTSTLWISGPVGTGKTHLGIAVARSVAEGAGIAVRVSTAREIVRELRDTWRTESHEREADAVARYGECSLLVLDDLGQGFSTDAEARQLGEVIDRRYSCSLPTVIISGQEPDAMATVIGARSYDRLSECATYVVCNWASHRTQAATE